MSNPAPLVRNLLAWYKKNARDLPWRRTRDPYKIWISEVMLQQTTVNAVIPYYRRWVKTFPSVRHVSRASTHKILQSWQGLGYYQRAKNIQKAAKVICALHDGKIPCNPDELRNLPGFGPYTTGAVASIAFDIPHPIIDANVRRVIMRILVLKGYADTSQDQEISTFLNKIMPSKNAGIFNQALMELGALVCRNREPVCLLCPVKSCCNACRRGIQEVIPQPKKRITKELNAAVGILRKENKYFIQKRPTRGLLADLWEFPGGKIETKETPIEALRREFKEELNIDIHSAQPLMQVRHSYTQFRVHLHVFLCQSLACVPEGATHKWVSLEGLRKYPMPSASVRIVDRLRSHKLTLDKDEV